MNPLIPFFVVIPLAGAFLIMITGRFLKEFDKYLTSLILLFLAIISFYSLSIVFLLIPSLSFMVNICSFKR